jgi:cell division septal protein FtsQ
MRPARRRIRINPDTLQLIRQILIGVLVLSFVALLIWAVWYVSRLPALTINEVTISGGETISHELVQTLVETELEGAYLRLIPKRFSFMYPENRIISVVEEIDRIKAITLEKTNRTTLLLTFVEYTPDALWCDKEAEQCVFLDSTGFAFAKAPSLQGGSFLRLEKLDVMPVTNVQAFDSHTYTRIYELVSLLETSEWFVESVAVDMAGDAYVHLTEGGELKVALADAPQQIVDNLFTVLRSPEFSEINPGTFEYIDLRFGNKVFVNEQTLASEPETATTTEPEPTSSE